MALTFKKWSHEHSTHYSYQQYALDIEQLNSKLEEVRKDFLNFTYKQSSKCETFKYWNNFVHRDCPVLFGFLLAI